MVRTAKRIPIPPQPKGAGAPPKYPWLTMAKGESFLFAATIQHPRVQASQATKRYAPRRFVTATTPKGVRCWRFK